MLKTCNVTVYIISIFNIIQLIFNILLILPNFIQLIQLLLVGIMFQFYAPVTSVACGGMTSLEEVDVTSQDKSIGLVVMKSEV